MFKSLICSLLTNGISILRNIYFLRAIAALFSGARIFHKQQASAILIPFSCPFRSHLPDKLSPQAFYNHNKLYFLSKKTQ